MKAKTLTQRFCRWLWLKSTGEDLFALLRQRDTLEILNVMHGEFVNELDHQYPEVRNKIQQHHCDRALALEEYRQKRLEEELGIDRS